MFVHVPWDIKSKGEEERQAGRRSKDMRCNDTSSVRGSEKSIDEVEKDARYCIAYTTSIFIHQTRFLGSCLERRQGFHNVWFSPGLHRQMYRVYNVA